MCITLQFFGTMGDKKREESSSSSDTDSDSDSSSSSSSSNSSGSSSASSSRSKRSTSNQPDTSIEKKDKSPVKEKSPVEKGSPVGKGSPEPLRRSKSREPSIPPQPKISEVAAETSPDVKQVDAKQIDESKDTNQADEDKDNKEEPGKPDSIPQLRRSRSRSKRSSTPQKPDAEVQEEGEIPKENDENESSKQKSTEESRSRRNDRKRSRSRSRSTSRRRDRSRDRKRSRSYDRSYDRRRDRRRRSRSNERRGNERKRSRSNERRRDGRDRSGDRDRRRDDRRRDDRNRRRSKSKTPEKTNPESITKKQQKTVDILTSKTGGAYIPPAKLRAMQAQITDKSSAAFQRIAWEALKKSIHGHINKVNVDNIGIITRHLLKENIVRGRGLLCRSIIQAQAASPTFTHVYAALVAVINSKFPSIGELLLHRLVIQFKRGFRRNDKPICISATRFIAHLVNQRVAHEILALEILTLLVEMPTDDSVEVAIAFLKECGMKLQEVSSKGINAIFEMLKNILHEGKLDKRVQYMIEVVFQVRKDGFKDHVSIAEALELVEEDEQFTHLLMLDEATDTQDILSKYNRNLFDQQCAKNLHFFP